MEIKQNIKDFCSELKLSLCSLSLATPYKPGSHQRQQSDLPTKPLQYALSLPLYPHTLKVTLPVHLICLQTHTGFVVGALMAKPGFGCLHLSTKPKIVSSTAAIHALPQLGSLYHVIALVRRSKLTKMPYAHQIFLR
jgi:hypothetical protein